jgi:hypothetical protein
MIATPRGRNVENIIPNSQQERGAGGHGGHELVQ